MRTSLKAALARLGHVVQVVKNSIDVNGNGTNKYILKHFSVVSLHFIRF